MTKQEAAEALALAVVCSVRQRHQMLTIDLVEQIANQWCHDYPQGSDRRAAAEIVAKTSPRPTYRIAALQLRDSGHEHLIGEGLTARHVTADQFAADLDRAGCRIKWRGDRAFEVDNRGDVYHRRTVRVQFYTDVNQFLSARGGNGTPLRSMAAVRRYLRLSAPTTQETPDAP